MAKAAILGYGVVGSGVFEVTRRNADIIAINAGEELQVKRILDLRDFPGNEAEKLITHNFEDIVNDEEISVVAEVMGGVEPAYTYVKRLLEAGKSVATSNKALVAAHGTELIEVAKQHNANFFFEASVGGGIPVIRNINTCLLADHITEISGILNGTTNYILSRMGESGRDFYEALSEAQEKGYAERDPAADIEGHDVARKLAILMSMVTRKYVDYADIPTEGITGITITDMEYAEKMRRSIKLLAVANFGDDGVYARVSPVMVRLGQPVAAVNNAFNAITIKSDVLGETMLYGHGAGSLPTGSAVVTDMIDAVRHKGKNLGYGWSAEKLEINPSGGEELRKLVRVRYSDKDKAFNLMKELYGSLEIVELAHVENEFAFLTQKETEQVLCDKAEAFTQGEGVEKIVSQIVMY